MYLHRILNDQKCDDDCSDARSESRYLSSLIGVLTEASACDAHPTGSSGRATKVNVSIDVGYIIKIQLSDSVTDCKKFTGIYAGRHTG